MDPAYKGDMDEYKLELETYVKQSSMYRVNLHKAYGVVLGQCTPRLKRALEATSNWIAIEEEAKVFKLMVAIRKQVRSADTTDHYDANTLAYAVTEFYKLVQQYNQSDEAYYREFKARYDMVHQNGGLLGGHPLLIKKHAALEGDIFESQDSNTEAKKGGSDLESFKAQSYLKIPRGDLGNGLMKAEQAYLVVCFLRQANKERHGNIITDLKNSYTIGDDRYPRMVTDAYKLLLRYKNYQGGGGIDIKGVILNTVAHREGTTGSGNSSKSKNADKKCYACGKMGHISYDCPAERNKNMDNHNTHATVEDEGEGGPPSHVEVGGEISTADPDDRLALIHSQDPSHRVKNMIRLQAGF